MSNETLIEEIRAGCDRQALLYRLYDNNRPLITNWAKAFTGQIEFEDAMQEAFIALSKAVDAFKPGKGYKFTTYYFHALRRHLTRVANGNKGMPDYVGADVAQYKTFCFAYQNENGHLPDLITTSKSLCWNIRRTARAMEWAQIEIISLSAPVTDDGLTIETAITDDRDVIGAVIDAASIDPAARLVWSVVDELPDDQRAAIRGRYKEEKTFWQLCAEMESAPERIEQTTEAALRALRRPDRLQRFQAVLDVYGIGCHLSGLGAFRSLGASSVEYAVMKMEQIEMIQNAKNRPKMPNLAKKY